MSETQTRALGYDQLTPRTAHPDLTASQFQEFFGDAEGPILNVGAGGTPLLADLRYRNINADVVALDPSYTTEASDIYQGYKVPGKAQELNFPDGTFATTVSHFVMQHLPEKEDVSNSIKEMVRVTRSVNDVKDHTAGTILIGPVFDVPTLTDLIFENGFQDVCGIQDPPAGIKDKAALPSLIIKKIPALTTGESDRVGQLATMIAESGALTTRRTVAEKISRLMRGRSRV
jgi:hypothetical protein